MIADLLRWHVEDPQCLRVFFGAVGRPDYCGVLRELRTHNKITLVQERSVDESLESLGIATVTLPVANPAHEAGRSVAKVAAPHANSVGDALTNPTVCHILAVLSTTYSHTDTSSGQVWVATSRTVDTSATAHRLTTRNRRIRC
jgi:hypothetical protein